MKAILALIHNRNYVLYWFASMFSVFGIIILQFVISLYVFDLTGDPVLFGSLLFVAIVPRLILYPLAGMWADRYSRHLQMVVSVIFASIMLAGFSSVHFLVAPLTVPALFVLVMLLEAFDILFMSANMSVPPMIVPEEQLGAANSAGVLYSDFGYVVGVVFGALVYGAFGFGWSLLGIMFCLALSFFFLLPLKLELPNKVADNVEDVRCADGAAADAADGSAAVAGENAEDVRCASPDNPTVPNKPAALHRPTDPNTSIKVEQLRFEIDEATPAVGSGVGNFFRELSMGARYVIKDRLLLVLFIISIVFNFFCIPIWDIVLLFFVRGDLGLDSESYGLYTGVQAAGDFLVAFVFAGLYSDYRALRFIRVFPFIVVGSLLVMLVAGFIVSAAPLAPVLIISALGSAFVAMAVTAYVICKNTIVQKRVPEKNLSRVFSINRMTALVVFPFGNLLYGFLVGYLGYIGSIIVSMVGISLLLIATLSLTRASLKAPDVPSSATPPAKAV